MATKRYKRDFKELEARRRRGMQMLARGVMQADVARACEVSRQTVSIWAKKLAGDRQAWRRRPLGRPGSMDMEQRKQLSKMLIAGAITNGFPTEVWTLARIGTLIKREFGHVFGTTHVWRIVRELGFSSQRPTGRALQRDERAIKEWKTKRWPALKKTPNARPGPPKAARQSCNTALPGSSCR
ncbi:MAG TPA: winged helix-turn-helix domain-containing protein [Casimicrobiaceae bacterium]|nr:winged helix-turn-helix domain-containing protein [Casimicrobiaceae bacterium]